MAPPPIAADDMGGPELSASAFDAALAAGRGDLGDLDELDDLNGGPASWRSDEGVASARRPRPWLVLSAALVVGVMLGAAAWKSGFWTPGAGPMPSGVVAETDVALPVTEVARPETAVGPPGRPGRSSSGRHRPAPC